MIALKQLVNGELYDEQNAKAGIVEGIALEKTTGKCLLIADGKQFAFERLTVKGNKITARGLQSQSNALPSVLNKSAYDLAGRLLGTAVDGQLGAKGTLCKLLLNNGEALARTRVVAIGDIILIKIPKPTNPKTPKRKPTQKNEKETPTERREDNSAPVVPSKRPSVRRRYGDFSFLLGKTADKSVTNFYGEVMIRAGETVTADILRQAKLSGKLIELCLHVM